MESNRILIDGRAFKNDTSSVCTYLFSLCVELFKEKSLQFVLIVNSSSNLKMFESNSNVTVVLNKTKNNFVWDNLIIPYYSLKYRCKTIFYPKSSTCWFRIPKKRIVVTIHGMIYKIEPKDHPFYVNFYWRLVGKIASIVSSRIIAVSEHDKKDLLSEGYRESKISVIPIGVSKNFEKKYNDVLVKETLNNYGLLRKNYIVQVGKISPKKNQLFTLELFKTIIAKSKSYKLVFIGPRDFHDEYAKKVDKWIEENNLGGSVVFTDALLFSSPEFPILIQNASIAMFPSTYEGFGMPTVESIASGVVVLSSDRGALEDVLGIENVISLENREEWFSKVERLLSEDDFYKNEYRKQFNLLAKYDWENIAKEYLKILIQKNENFYHPRYKT